MPDTAEKKPKHRLYDDQGQYNELGQQLDTEFHGVIREWFNRKVAEGINVRELWSIMDGATADIALMELAGWGASPTT